MLTASDAGVDTWSAAWYLDPHSDVFDRFRETCTVASARGSRLLPEPVDGYRVGCYANGLTFAEGHPVTGRLAGAVELPVAGLALQERLVDVGVPVDTRTMPFGRMSSDATGFAGIRRLDVTLNLEATKRSEGVALLAGIAAVARDAVGHAEVRFGLDHAVETVYFRGYAGKRMLGRWYDKGLESGVSERGSLIRGEDQRRYSKEARRDLSDLTAGELKRGFERRFYPLWKASKGVTVAGHVVLAERLVELVDAGDLTARQAEALAGHLLLRVAAGRRGLTVSRATMYRRESQLREAGLVLADGVLDEVEVDVASVLEAAMESDVWGATG